MPDRTSVSDEKERTFSYEIEIRLVNSKKKATLRLFQLSDEKNIERYNLRTRIESSSTITEENENDENRSNEDEINEP
ncbi:4945_t:CDS:2, partial [Funneliformis geosporum]